MIEHSTYGSHYRCRSFDLKVSVTIKRKVMVCDGHLNTQRRQEKKVQQVFEMTLFRGLKRVKVISHARQMIRVSVVSNSANLQLIECNLKKTVLE